MARLLQAPKLVPSQERQQLNSHFKMTEISFDADISSQHSTRRIYAAYEKWTNRQKYRLVEISSK